MSATQTKQTEVFSEQGLDENLMHTVCCEDDDVALCGLDLSETPWATDEAEPPCRHCERLYAAMEADDACNRCPLDVFEALGDAK